MWLAGPPSKPKNIFWNRGDLAVAQIDGNVPECERGMATNDPPQCVCKGLPATMLLVIRLGTTETNAEPIPMDVTIVRPVGDQVVAAGLRSRWKIDAHAHGGARATDLER